VYIYIMYTNVFHFSIKKGRTGKLLFTVSH